MRRLVVGSALSWALACAGPQEDPATLREQAQGMNLLVVLFDAAAADHFSFLGYERATTPNLSSLVEESIVFENAYAQAAATPLSIVSLFTGRYPVGRTLPDFQGEIVPAIRGDRATLASSLEASHPQRIAFSANRWVCDELGYARGFVELRELWADEEGEVVRGVVSAQYLTDALLASLEDDLAEPFFVYAHYLEPHLPYTPPEPYASLFDPENRGLVECTTAGLKPYRASKPPKAVRANVVGLYDGNLAYADAQFARIVAALKKDGRWDRTVLIFLSDHGEAFWQHNWRGHGAKVFEEFVRVPLLVRVPGLPGRRIEDVVELVDIMPTLLDLFGHEQPEELSGQSWLPRFFTDTPADSLAQMAFFRNHEVHMDTAIREGNFKLVRKGSQPPRLDLFDLSRDPMEARNLQSHRTPALKDSTAALSARLGARLERILENGVDSSPLGEGGADSLSAEAIERLKALGYFN